VPPATLFRGAADLIERRLLEDPGRIPTMADRQQLAAEHAWTDPGHFVYDVSRRRPRRRNERMTYRDKIRSPTCLMASLVVASNVSPYPAREQTAVALARVGRTRIVHPAAPRLWRSRQSGGAFKRFTCAVTDRLARNFLNEVRKLCRLFDPEFKLLAHVRGHQMGKL
jgi:hypothetical protein